MQPHVDWLSESEKELICEQAIDLLERMGMRMAGAKVLGALSEAGARVDQSEGVVRFPSALVEAAVSKFPKRILLAAAAEEQDVVLDESVHFCNSGTASHVLDFQTGAHRASTSEDFRQAVVVYDAMPDVNVVWSPVVSNDLPSESRRAVEWPIMVSETSKHVKLSFDGNGPSPVHQARRLFEILSGDLNRFRKRPRAHFVCCTVSPLEVNGQLLDSSIELAGLGAPICIYPMPISGATAPVTLPGTLVLNVAEFLGVATAIQTVHPGAPLIMGCGSSVLDMHAATFSFGALEGGLMSAACTEVAHHIGVPILCPGMATDAKYVGIQAGYEKALKALTVAMAGSDLITGGIGVLNAANSLYLPQIVIDSEIASMIRRVIGGISVSDHDSYADVIESVGRTGNYLGMKETRVKIRSGEHFLPYISSRLSYEAWQAGGVSELDVAQARVNEILEARAGRTSYLTEDQADELRTAFSTEGVRSI